MDARKAEPEALGESPQTREDKIAQVLAECSDRLNAGQQVNIEEIQASHPDLGPELAAALEALWGVDPTFRKDQVVQALGDYEIVREIGCGGMGAVVYEAWQKSTSRRVALKVLSGGFLANPKALDRFKREMTIAGRLDHPGVCTVYDAGVVEGTPYIAMRYIEGESLARRIMRARGKEAASTGQVDSTFQGLEKLAKDEPRVAPRPADRPTQPPAQKEIAVILRTIEYVARTLHMAHEAGLIHRDIKPGNIMITNGGDPVIIDFGLARSADQPRLTQAGELMGTPPYMSPEQISGRPHNQRTDVYSLGVTLYEWLTYRLPFDAPTRQGIYQKILGSDPPAPRKLNPHISKDLKIVLETALEKNVDRRYQRALDFAEDLRRIQAHEPVRARPTGLFLHCSRFAQKYPGLTTLMAVVCLLLATAVSLLVRVMKEKDAVLSERNKTDMLLDILRGDKRNEIERLWDDPDVTDVVFRSEQRSLLDGTETRNLNHADTLRIKFGVYTHKKPESMRRIVSPVLAYLEETMMAALSRPVGIDLVIYRDYNLCVEASADGKVDFVRLGGAPYVRAKNKNPNIEVLAAQDQEFNGCIFTRDNSGIGSIDDLRRKRILFGDRDSTTGNYVSKSRLAQAGIFLRNVPGSININDLATMGIQTAGHETVVDLVRNGTFAAGAAKEGEVLKHKDLRILQTFPSISMPWVARSGLDPKIGDAIQRSLLPLKDMRILASLEDNVAGFKLVTDEYYDRMRGEMKKAEEFDSSK